MSATSATQLSEMSEEQLEKRYEEAFKKKLSNLDKAATEKQWKKANAEAVLGKCGVFYNEIMPTSGEYECKKTAKAAGCKSALERAGATNPEADGTKLIEAHTSYMKASSYSIWDILEEGAGGGMQTGGQSEKQKKSRAAGSRLISAHDSVRRSAGCDSVSAANQKMEAAWQEYRAEELYEIVQADVQQVGQTKKQESIDCAQELLKQKELLQKAIDLFWEAAAHPESGFWSDAAVGRSYAQALRGKAVGTPGWSTVAAELADLTPEDIQRIQLGMLENPVPGSTIRGVTGNSTKALASSSPAPTIPDYMIFSQKEVTDNNYYGRYINWDFLLLEESVRKDLKVPELFADISDSSTTTLAHLHASLPIGWMNTIELEVPSQFPDQSMVDAFAGGSDGSSANLYQAAEDMLTTVEKNQTLLVLGTTHMPDGTDLTDWVEHPLTPSANLLPAGPTKQWLVNDAYPAMNTILAKIRDMANCIKEKKDEFDDFVDNVSDAAEKLGGDALDDDIAEDEFEKATANLEDTDLDDISFQNVSSKKLFKEQCFLLAFAAKIAAFKKKTLDYSDGATAKHRNGVHKRLPYTNLESYEIKQTEFAKKSEFNACLQMTGDSFGFINKLTQSPNYSDFLDIPHHQLSALQPMIRLFKVVYNEDVDAQTGRFNDLEKEVEMKFNSAFSKDELQDVFKDRRTRSAGVGLKNFEFTYDGSNPFSYKKSIKAKLTLHSATFQELFLQRSGDTKILDNGKLKLGGPETYRYIDLALKTFSKFKNDSSISMKYQKLFDENANMAKLNFRLKAVVGWSVPPGKIPGLSTTQKERLKTVLSNSFVTLNLTPTIHNFNFQQDGSVSLEIDYLAYVDDFFDDRGFNVFADPYGVVGWQRELRKMQMTRVRAKCSSAKDIQDLNEKHKDVIEKEVNDSLSSLIDSLIKNKKIFYINLDYEKIQNFIASGPYEKYEDYIIKSADGDLILSDDNRDAVTNQVINSAIEAYQGQLDASQSGSDESEISLGAALFAASPQSNELSFFYLSDLIDVVLENIELELEKLIEHYVSQENKSEYTTTSDTNLDKVHIDDWNKRRADLEKYQKNLKRFRILLGPVELQHHKYEASGTPAEFVNFGDLPISVKYFLEWMAGKVLSKDEVFYSLSVFLNQLMNNLVAKFLNNNQCFYFDIKQKIRVNQSTLTSFTPPEYHRWGAKDEITYLIRKKASVMKNGSLSGTPTSLNLNDSVVVDHRGYNGDGTIKGKNWKNLAPILNVSGRPNLEFSNYSPLSFETNYMVFYAGRITGAGGEADRDKDHDRGIFHYLLGRDRGLVKEINLQKTTSKGLAEARFEMDGYDGLQQLRVVYDLDITSYANVNTFPGTYIYVPPAGFDPSFARHPVTTLDKDGKVVNIDMAKLGIGGYYMIIRSTHTFGAGEAQSKIYAKWVANLKSDYPQSEGGVGASNSTSCTNAIAARNTEMEKP